MHDERLEGSAGEGIEHATKTEERGKKVIPSFFATDSRLNTGGAACPDAIEASGDGSFGTKLLGRYQSRVCFWEGEGTQQALNSTCRRPGESREASWRTKYYANQSPRGGTWTYRYWPCRCTMAIIDKRANTRRGKGVVPSDNTSYCGRARTHSENGLVKAKEDRLKNDRRDGPKARPEDGKPERGMAPITPENRNFNQTTKDPSATTAAGRPISIRRTMLAQFFPFQRELKKENGRVRRKGRHPPASAKKEKGGRTGGGGRETAGQPLFHWPRAGKRGAVGRY